ncbi:MAG: hypothetical protein KTR30_20390 [Saprospiraceae bacterium]|nr:hypothetical protein [Saprospiraceae bacterium]
MKTIDSVKLNPKKLSDNDLHQYCDSIRNHVAKFRLEEAFKETNKLIGLIGEESYQIRVTHLEARYNKYKSDKQKNTLTEEIASITLSRIIDDFLQFLQNLDIHRTLKLNFEKIEDIKLQVSKLSAKLSLNIEIAKERINRLGECWTSMYTFENQLFKVIEEFIINLVDFKAVSSEARGVLDCFKYTRNLDNLYQLLVHPELRPLLENGNLKTDTHDDLLQKMVIVYLDYQKADLILEQNKFWLGPEIYKEARKYHDCYPRVLQQYKEKNYLGCLSCLEYQKQAAGSIENIIQKFQERIF